MKKLNVLGAFFATIFGPGKNAIKVDEKENEASFTGEQTDAMADAIEQLDAANAEVNRLNDELKALGSQITASAERLSAIEAALGIDEGADALVAIASLKKLPGSAGSGVRTDSDDDLGGGADPVRNSWDLKAEKRANLQAKKEKTLH